MTYPERLSRLAAPATVYGAPFGLDIKALGETVLAQKKLGLYVARDDKAAAAAEKISEFMFPALSCIRLPGWDTLPYDRISPAPAIAAARCAGLAQLAMRTGNHSPCLVITTASAVLQRVPPVETMRASSLSLGVSERIAQAALTDYLGINGYVRTPSVSEKGEYSIRGGKVDLFPPNSNNPVRLDLFGDEIETIKSFDPETQLSTGTLKRVDLYPVSEILLNERSLSGFRERYLAELGSPAGDPMYEAVRAEIRRQGVESWLPLFHDHLETVFDYIGGDALIGFGYQAPEAIKERLTQAQDYYEARIEAAGTTRAAKVLKPAALYLTEADLDTSLATRPVARFNPSQDNGALSLNGVAGRNFAPERQDNEINIFAVAAEYAAALRQRDRTVVFAAWTDGSAERLVGVLRDHGLKHIDRVYSLEAARESGLAISELPLESGFETDDLVVIAEPDVLGDRLAAPRRKRKAANFITEASSLKPGDLVVHVDHGVGRYEGLRTLDLAGAAHDCLELGYAKGDKIFLPVENIDLISRYGSEEADTAIDLLGGVGWQTRKAKAKKRILEMAAELMAIAAARALKSAEPVQAGDGLYEEFAAKFPHDETDDQLNAIEDVLGDLCSGQPMDRLVCGDVGFGKTEVAMRAAFVAAMAGKQVAVIAPTTLLARQHFTSFHSRFAGLPLNVKHLSRFVGPKEAAATREGLAAGTVDLVIGTHALLAQSVNFKRLALLIVDEEQRFGVKHKERMKELKADVHVLTLSATPIPRTLQMALTGIRDLSIIATPPVDRLAVRTYITEFDAVTIREALLREKYRGGQSYFVAPRIADLDYLEDFLRANVPEVKFCVAHGQMPAGELEDLMTAFYDGVYDVLLSTTIVESGLDIPRANTLIIHKADRFGLAQLYQLRGRVGRSKLRAYAYLTTPADRSISTTAERRLRVLQSLDSLGAGFQLASHDLDMRGGGNLLGDQQSGHVREVGVELYQSMLEDAVKALQSGASGSDVVADDWSPQINLGVSVLIPETYVEDLGVRLGLYRRLAETDTEQAREAFAAELIDRFGPLPDSTRQLLDVTAIKGRCKALGINKLDVGPKAAVLTFRTDTIIEPAELMRLVRSRPAQMRLRPDSKLVVQGLANKPDLRINAIKGLLRELEGMVPAQA